MNVCPNCGSFLVTTDRAGDVEAKFSRVAEYNDNCRTGSRRYFSRYDLYCPDCNRCYNDE